MFHSAPCVEVTEEPISWGVAVQVYWAILWRTALIYFVMFAPFNALYLWLLATGRIEESTNFFALRLVLAWLILLVASLIALKMALRTRYHGFRIQITREQVS